MHPITTDRKAEAPALSPAELESGVHEFIDADYRGNLEGSPLAVFPDGDEWKEEVGAVVSLQKYKLHLKGLDQLPVVKAALDYAPQQTPTDFVFLPVELAKL